MISEFIEGPAKLLAYIITHPRILVSMLITGLILVILAIVPTAIYVYPFWKSSVTVDSFPEIHSDTLDLDILISRPIRLLPGQDDHELVLEIKNLHTDTVTTTVSIDKDQTYVNFADQPILPIVSANAIPPNARIVEHFPFSIAGNIHPRAPTEFKVQVRTRSGSVEISFSTPVDHLSVPVIAIVISLIPVIGLILKLIGEAMS